ncbi:copper chaperone PCu(A)C [Deefgea salmonis]|uniref:Copper chaperone PCu(A)C n=1 Tax=Deefgea salmonis TaxID=2875502 RepID=A0ABS8BLX1_9NEIS|nr:copper chaperone PCu(A)C [Deefgea salmonis]MCB5196708.1 copper chaperone PCu(A)C [Deefgea salmonis]
MLKKLTLCAALTVSASLSFAQEPVSIDQVWARATPPQAANAGVFMSITSPTTDQLLSASSVLARKTEIHEMIMADGVMKMRQITTGLPITSQQPLTLAPGGYHIMLLGLKKDLVAGEKLPLTLHFAKAGAINVTIDVQNIAHRPAAAAHAH